MMANPAIKANTPYSFGYTKAGVNMITKTINTKENIFSIKDLINE